MDMFRLDIQHAVSLFVFLPVTLQLYPPIYSDKRSFLSLIFIIVALG